MGSNKTLDGIKIPKIVSFLSNIPGIKIRRGTNHPFVAMSNIPGLRPCPIAASTHAERMIAPWLSRATGLEKREAYNSLRSGQLPPDYNLPPERGCK
jgi:hypothetical protein